MHRIFRKALDNATGETKTVIAVIIDVRDFSRFSKGRDSVEVAQFITRVYIQLIDSYFPFASFYKSTGDGLLITVPVGRHNLVEACQEVVASCIKCHSEFSNICKDDPMITFTVPKEIGIGIAKGPACLLVSRNKTIDYCGRVINLTSRLTELARPSGIVIDGEFNINLLTEEQKALFQKEENIYLYGIAEDKPIAIYFTPEFTTIPEYRKWPLAKERWREMTRTMSCGILSKLSRHAYDLKSEPARPEDIIVKATYEKVSGRTTLAGIQAYIYFKHFKYQLEAGKPRIVLDMPKLCEELRENKVTKNMDVTITIKYPEK